MKFRVTKVKNSEGVKALFNKFSGHEIAVIEKHRDVKIGAKTMTMTHPRLAHPEHASLDEMKQVAKENGLALHIWMPGSARPMEDYNPGRVNVHVEKSEDGKYRVSGKFRLG